MTVIRGLGLLTVFVIGRLRRPHAAPRSPRRSLDSLRCGGGSQPLMTTDLSLFPPARRPSRTRSTRCNVFLVAVSAFFTILISLLVIVFAVR
jgi:hypothetical protein